MNHLWIAAVTATVTALVSPGSAQPFSKTRLAGDMPTTPILNMLQKRLDLTEEQSSRVEQILSDAKAEIRQPAEQIKQVFERTHSQIRDVLTPDQQEEAQRMKRGLFEGVAGFAQDHKERLRESAAKAGDEIRLRVAISELDLTDEQRQELEEIRETTREKREEIQEALRPKMDELRENARNQIESVLTEEQRTELEKKIQEMPKPGQRREMREGRKPGDREGRRSHMREGRRPGEREPRRAAQRDGQRPERREGRRPAPPQQP